MITLNMSDANLRNTSYLTVNLYVFLYSCYAQGKALTPLFVIAFITTVGGAVLYYRQPPPHTRETSSGTAVARYLYSGRIPGKFPNLDIGVT